MHIYAKVDDVGPSDQQKDKGASRGLSVGICRVVSEEGLRCLEQYGHAAPTLLASSHYMFSSLAMKVVGPEQSLKSRCSQ